MQVRASQALRSFWKALVNVWEELLLLALMNGLTVLPLILLVFSPLLLLGTWDLGSRELEVALGVLAAIPILGFPPAVAALWHVGNTLAGEQSIHWSDYFAGFRRYLWKSWQLALLNGVVFALVAINVTAYGPSNPFNLPFDLGSEASSIVRGVFVVAGSLWLVFQMYPLAMLMEQEDQRWRVALRNSFIVFVASPGFSLVTAVLLLLLTVVSIVAPIILVMFTLSIFAVVCNQAVKRLLEPFREQTRAEGQERPSKEKQK